METKRPVTRTYGLMSICIATLIIALAMSSSAASAAGTNFQRIAATQYSYSSGDVQNSTLYPEGGVVLSKSWLEPGIVEYLITLPEKNTQVTSLNLNYIGKNNAYFGITSIALYNWETNEYDIKGTANNNEPSSGSLWSISIERPQRYVNYYGRILVKFDASANSEYHLKEVGVDYSYDSLTLIKELTPPYQYTLQKSTPEYLGLLTTTYSNTQIDRVSGRIDLLSAMSGIATSGKSYTQGGIGGPVTIPYDGTYRISAIYRVKGVLVTQNKEVIEPSEVSAIKFALGLKINDTSENIYEKSILSKDIVDGTVSLGKEVLFTYLLVPFKKAGLLINLLLMDDGFDTKNMDVSEQALTESTYINLKKGDYAMYAYGLIEITQYNPVGSGIVWADFSQKAILQTNTPSDEYIQVEKIKIEAVSVQTPIEELPVTSIEVLPSSVKEGNVTEVILTFKNIGNTTITNPTYSFDGRVLEQNAVSLKPGQTASYVVTVDATGVSAGSTITKKARIEGKYNYGKTTSAKDFSIYLGVTPKDSTNIGSLLESHTCNSLSVTAMYSGDSDSDGSATLYYKRTSSSSWTNAGLMAKSVDKYTKTISGLSENTNYDIQVSFADPDGTIGTNPIQKTSINLGLCGSGYPPTPVLDDPGSINSEGIYNVKWSYIASATYYELEESGTNSNLYNISTPIKQLSGKENGVYQYRVRSCNKFGCGSWSNTESIEVALIPLPDNVYAYAGRVYSGRLVLNPTDLEEYVHSPYQLVVNLRAYPDTFNIYRARAIAYRGSGNVLGTVGLEVHKISYEDEDNLQISMKTAGMCKIYPNEYFCEEIILGTRTSGVYTTPMSMTLLPGASQIITLNIPRAAGEFYFDGSAEKWAVMKSGKEVEVSIPAGTPNGTYHLTIMAIANTNDAYSVRDIEVKVIKPNQAPNQPMNPSPVTGANGQAIDLTLSWNGGDPDGDAVTYTVFLDSGENPATQRCQTTSMSCVVSGLEYNTQYNWKVIADDTKSAPVSSAIWTFITKNPPNNAPYQPGNPYPASNDVNQSSNLTLIWKGGDPDGNAVTYTIYLDKNANPTTNIYTGLFESYSLSGLSPNTTYYWKVVASDGSLSSSGPIWQFTTKSNPVPPQNRAPYQPSTPSPANNGVNQTVNLTLTWQGGDPDGNAVTYTVYLNKSTSFVTKIYHGTSKSYAVSNLNPNTTYYWKVVASDGSLSNSSPVWKFTTKATTTPPPTPPPAPSNGTNVALASNGATATGGYVLWAGRNTDELIDGQVTGYGWDTGYASVDLNVPMIVTLNKTYSINRVKILLFNLDTRYYRYKVETSADNLNWALAVNKTTGTWSGWQNDTFSARNAKYIRITGNYNSAGNGIFHVIELEAYANSTAAPANRAPYQPSTPSPANNGVNQTVNLTLTWQGGDPDGNAVTYTVYLNKSTSFVTKIYQGTSKSYAVSNLNPNTTYYWKVVASDGSLSNSSPVWKFTTKAIASPPAPPPSNTTNVALASNGATATGGYVLWAGRNTDELIDGQVTGYGWDTGYASTDLNAPMTITLNKTYSIGRIKVLLFDLDTRYYRYKVETSTDNLNWTLAINKTTGTWRGWQNDTFSARNAKYIRITGNYNSAGNGIFHAIELEVYGP